MKDIILKPFFLPIDYNSCELISLKMILNWHFFEMTKVGDL